MIESYTCGKMIIQGRPYCSDLIICPGKIPTIWERRKKHQVTISDLVEIIEFQPDYVLIGTGEEGKLRVLPETQEHLKQHGIQVIFEATKHVYTMFNAVYNKCRIIGAFHLGS